MPSNPVIHFPTGSAFDSHNLFYVWGIIDGDVLNGYHVKLRIQVYNDGTPSDVNVDAHSTALINLNPTDTLKRWSFQVHNLDVGKKHTITVTLLDSAQATVGTPDAADIPAFRVKKTKE